MWKASIMKAKTNNLRENKTKKGKEKCQNLLLISSKK